MKLLQFDSELVQFWPQIFMLILWTLLCIREISIQNKPRVYAFNIYKVLMLNSVILFVLYKGGFFNVMGFVQYFVLIFGLCVMSFKIYTDFFGNKPDIQSLDIPNNNIFSIVRGYVIILFIYWLGGFFDSFLTYLNF
jgi:hypothetical protein